MPFRALNYKFNINKVNDKINHHLTYLLPLLLAKYEQ